MVHQKHVNVIARQIFYANKVYNLELKVNMYSSKNVGLRQPDENIVGT
jgi:hypothetical protein